jgi:type I restriction enzyme S subunit
MSDWKETTIGELLTLQRGHDLVQTEFIEGPYIVAGSNGPIGYHNQFTTEGPGLTIGRSGLGGFNVAVSQPLGDHSNWQVNISSNGVPEVMRY